MLLSVANKPFQLTVNKHPLSVGYNFFPQNGRPWFSGALWCHRVGVGARLTYSHEAAHHLFGVLRAPGVGEADERAVDGNPRTPLQLQRTHK